MNLLKNTVFFTVITYLILVASFFLKIGGHQFTTDLFYMFFFFLWWLIPLVYFIIDLIIFWIKNR